MADSSYQDTQEISLEDPTLKKSPPTRREFLREMGRIVKGVGATMALAASGIGVGPVVAQTEKESVGLPQGGGGVSFEEWEDFNQRNNQLITSPKEGEVKPAYPESVITLDEFNRQKILEGCFTDQQMNQMGIRVAVDCLDIRFQRSILQAYPESRIAKVLGFAQQRLKLKPVTETPNLYGYDKKKYSIITPGFSLRIVPLPVPFLDLDSVRFVTDSNLKEEFLEGMRARISTGRTTLGGFVDWRWFVWPDNRDFDLKNIDTGERIEGLTHYKINMFMAAAGVYLPNSALSLPGYDQLTTEGGSSSQQLQNPDYWIAKNRQYTDAKASIFQLAHHELGHVAAALFPQLPNDEPHVDTAANQEIITARKHYEDTLAKTGKGDTSKYPLVLIGNGQFMIARDEVKLAA